MGLDWHVQLDTKLSVGRTLAALGAVLRCFRFIHLLCSDSTSSYDIYASITLVYIPVRDMPVFATVPSEHYAWPMDSLTPKCMVGRAMRAIPHSAPNCFF